MNLVIAARRHAPSRLWHSRMAGRPGLICWVLLIIAAGARAETLIVLTSEFAADPHAYVLHITDSGLPSVDLRTVTLHRSSLVQGLYAICKRPATGELYGISFHYAADKTHPIYPLYLSRIDVASGEVAHVGDAFTTVSRIDSIGADFNPQTDQLRVVFNKSNYFLDPKTGARVGDPQFFDSTMEMSGTAYPRPSRLGSLVGATPAAPYFIDTRNHRLYRLPDTGLIALPGSTGAVGDMIGLTLMGTLGVTDFKGIGFDISPVTGTAYLATLYPTQNSQVNLATGDTPPSAPFRALWPQASRRLFAASPWMCRRASPWATPR